MKNFFKNIKNWNASLKLGTAITLGGIIIVGSSLIYASNQPTSEPPISYVTTSNDNTTTSVNPPVDEKVEEIIRPYTVKCNIDHYFYEETASSEIKAKSIVSIPGTKRTYMLSEGCDYSYDGKDFDVVASISGTVTDKINDASFGNIIILTHENGIKFIYASLDEVVVNKGQKVSQGDKIAKAGTSLYTEKLGKSLHFEIVKGDVNLNPEKLYSTSIEKI